MKLYGADWAEYKVSDFIISWGVPIEYADDAESPLIWVNNPSEHDRSFYTIRTSPRCTKSWVLMYIALESGGMKPEEWIQEQINNGIDMLNNPIDWDDIST